MRCLDRSAMQSFVDGELDSLSADLRRKTEEVMLERELLARKSSHLSFLNRVLSRATASLDAGTILAKARTDLRHLRAATKRWMHEQGK